MLIFKPRLERFLLIKPKFTGKIGLLFIRSCLFLNLIGNTYNHIIPLLFLASETLRIKKK